MVSQDIPVAATDINVWLYKRNRLYLFWWQLLFIEQQASLNDWWNVWWDKTVAHIACQPCHGRGSPRHRVCLWSQAPLPYTEPCRRSMCKRRPATRTHLSSSHDGAPTGRLFPGLARRQSFLCTWWLMYLFYLQFENVLKWMVQYFTRFFKCILEWWAEPF